MSDLVSYTHEGDVAVITIDNPPVNALSPGVPEGIRAQIAAAAADPTVRAVVVIGGGRTFIAGADIREFGKVVSGEKPRGRKTRVDQGAAVALLEGWLAKLRIEREGDAT